MSGRYVGVYWTLPVNWARFRDLPPDVDAAAAASRTIRYQRERVRGWVREHESTLLGEVAFMDTRTDRATDAVQDVLRRAVPAYAGQGVLATFGDGASGHAGPPCGSPRVAGHPSPKVAKPRASQAS